MIRVFLSAVIILATSLVAHAQERYRIKSGDQLQVEVLEDPSLNRTALVLPDGTISFPLIGSVPVGGSTVSQVQNSITRGLAPNFATAPNVLVTVAQVSKATARSSGARSSSRSGGSMSIFIMGEVNSPGKKSVRRGTTLLQFLAESGGFTRFAATKRIQLRRNSGGKSMVYKFDYKAVERGATSVATMSLRNGDVIIVPERRIFE